MATMGRNNLLQSCAELAGTSLDESCLKTGSGINNPCPRLVFGCVADAIELAFQPPKDPKVNRRAVRGVQRPRPLVKEVQSL